jgi:hypothetical protein
LPVRAVAVRLLPLAGDDGFLALAAALCALPLLECAAGTDDAVRLADTDKTSGFVDGSCAVFHGRRMRHFDRSGNMLFILTVFPAALNRRIAAL